MVVLQHCRAVFLALTLAKLSLHLLGLDPGRLPRLPAKHKSKLAETQNYDQLPIRKSSRPTRSGPCSRAHAELMRALTGHLVCRQEVPAARRPKGA